MARKSLRGIHISIEGESEANITDENQNVDSDTTQPPSDNEQDSETPNNNSEPNDNFEEEYVPADEDDVDIEIRDDQGLVHRKRGKTNATHVWTLPDGHKIIVHCNNLGQPIKDGGRVLGSWLGTVARKKEFCSIEYDDWRKMPLNCKEDIINLTKRFFELPDLEQVQKWVLDSVSHKWRIFKHTLKNKHFRPEKTKQQIENNVPEGVFPNQWKKLVEYWFSEKSEMLSEKGKQARSKNKTLHTTGSMSFARKRAEYEASHGKQPGSIEFFEITHKRQDGTFINNQAQELVEKATNIVAERSATLEGSDLNAIEEDVFNEMIGKDQYGRVRGYGLGVTSRQLSGTHSQPQKKPCHNVMLQSQIDEIRYLSETKIADMKEHYDEKMIEMKNEYEAKMRDMKIDHEIKMAEIQKNLELLTSKLSRFDNNINGVQIRYRESQGYHMASRK